MTNVSKATLTKETMPVQVLLIEDNLPDALLVREALRAHAIEFTLHEAADAEQAVAYVERMGCAAQSPYPDVVILDLNLPGGDGLGVLETFRKREMCVNTPVIVMTSSESPNDRARVAQMGNARFFRKPPELDAFLDIGRLVREVLNKNTVSAGC